MKLALVIFCASSSPHLYERLCTKERCARCAQRCISPRAHVRWELDRVRPRVASCLPTHLVNEMSPQRNSRAKVQSITKHGRQNTTTGNRLVLIQALVKAEQNFELANIHVPISRCGRRWRWRSVERLARCEWLCHKSPGFLHTGCVLRPTISVLLWTLRWR